MKTKTAIFSLIPLLVCALQAQAATRLVPQQYDTIQAAIDACTDGDTVIVAPGLYTGDGNRDIDFKGKAITVKSEEGPKTCIIDSQGSDNYPRRGFYFHSAEDANSLLDGFTIKNGLHNNGGAVLCRYGHPSITNCIITANVAHVGGGIAASGGTTVSNCLIAGNSAHCGGALYSFGGSLTLTNCTITENRATLGAGVACAAHDGHLTITNCIIWDEPPAGVYEFYLPVATGCGGDAHGTGLTVDHSSMPEVQPGSGNLLSKPVFVSPGYWDACGTPEDPNDDFWVPGDYRLIPATALVDAGANTPEHALPLTDIVGAPRITDADYDGLAIVDIGAYECPPPEGPVIQVSCSELHFNAVESWGNPPEQSLTVRNAGARTLDWTAAADCNWLRVHPASGSSDGQTNEITLAADCPALSAGDYNCTLSIGDPNALYGPRQVAVTLHVGELVKVPSQHQTIQAAIDAVQNWDMVLVADGTYTGDGNRDIDFLGKSISVRSENGPEKCIIDCNASANREHRAFHFHGEEGPESVVDGFTIMNGRMSKGAAIFCYSSSPKITGCIIKNNCARTGGAISCIFAAPEIHDCIIAANSAEYVGGAIAISREYSHLTVSGCVLAANTALYGGAAFTGARAIFENCTFAANAALYGGAAFTGAKAIFEKCTFAANTALYGGAAACTEAKVIFENCTFAENIAHYGSAINCRDFVVLQLANSIIFDNRTYYTPPSYPPPGPRVPPDVPDWGLGLQVRADEDSAVFARHCNVEGGLAGLGNIDADPCFVAPGFWTDPNDPAAVVEPNHPNAVWVPGDYHLKSSGWRWDQTRRLWTWDHVTSPCIDAGNPGSPLADEPLSVPGDPNNEWGRNIRINMGAYGGTPEASIPPHNRALLADVTNDGTVDLTDLDHWSQNWLAGTAETPADLDRNAAVNLIDFALLADNWLARTTWRQP